VKKAFSLYGSNCAAVHHGQSVKEAQTVSPFVFLKQKLPSLKKAS
jgi:hypothetical protein